ncbi:hypothetical protein [Steroidobacter cummioxidans]|uniref:hypothetical protein n=1 Tax=Steroidobacter cummioxidans TaxID=1803913 RepID=UPI000E31E160|nr:hypothetical protein [Steroidobacter cummioxidans]
MKSGHTANSFHWWAAVGLTLASSAALAGTYKAPRTADGHPDLQGIWTNATLTPVERPKMLGNKLVLTEAEALQMEKRMQDFAAESDRPSDLNQELPKGNVGGYNVFWFDPANKVATVNGQRRSSLITFPEDGQVPALSELGQQRLAARSARAAKGAFDGPEQRAVGERCLLGFGSNSGPPMLPVMYNSNYQIVQSANTVLIHVEMVHDARIIRLGGKHLPDHVRKWMGDSIGHWEGDTLVVETTHFNPAQPIQIGQGASYRLIPISPKLKVIERFTRTEAQTIHYEFTVEDPDTFSTPWRGEIPFHYTDQPIYEYACHEGNYALPGILAGAREEEKAAAQSKQ